DRDMWRFPQPWPPDAPGKPGYDPNLPPGKGMGMAQMVAGNLVIGSTSRFVGLDRAPTLAGIRYVLESARRIAPAIGRLRMLRTWAGFPPSTPDGVPLPGPPPGVGRPGPATRPDRRGIARSPPRARPPQGRPPHPPRALSPPPLRGSVNPERPPS